MRNGERGSVWRPVGEFNMLHDLPRRTASGWYVGNEAGAGRLNKRPPARTPIASATAPIAAGTRKERFRELAFPGAGGGGDICPELVAEAGRLTMAREDSRLRLIRF